jgi:hypothetical protein
MPLVTKGIDKMDNANLKRFLLEVIENIIKNEDVVWWAQNYSYRSFDTPEKAREFIFQERERARKQGWGGSEEENKAFANAMPLKRVGKTYKIGKPQKQVRLDWAEVDIKPNDPEELATDGWINIFDGERLSRPRVVSVASIKTTEVHSQTKEGKRKAKAIAKSFSSPGAWFVPIVIDEQGSIVDGHHRFEAVLLLKLETVPVQVVLGRS